MDCHNVNPTESGYEDGEDPTMMELTGDENDDYGDGDDPDDCQILDPSDLEQLLVGSRTKQHQQHQQQQQQQLGAENNCNVSIDLSLPNHPNDKLSSNRLLPKDNDSGGDGGGNSKMDDTVIFDLVTRNNPMTSGMHNPPYYQLAPPLSPGNGTGDNDQKRIIPSPPPSPPPPPPDVPSSSMMSLLSPPSKLGQKEIRRRNRRRLYRLLKNPKVLPSFIRLIEEPSSTSASNNTKINTDGNNVNTDANDATDDDDDDDFLLEPPMVVIDVDEYLGLKKRKFPDPIESVSSGVSSIYIPNNNNIIKTSKVTSSTSVSPRQRRQQQQQQQQKQQPSNARIMPNVATSSSSLATLSTLRPNVPSSGVVPSSSTAITSNNPADEGWYEGVVPMVQLPEDEMYLTDIQLWTRRNLEYFSATDQDVLMSQSGRRTPTVRGKVGIRCIHCAKAVMERLRQQQQQQNQDGVTGGGPRISWPAGSVSYPLNFAGLYSGAIQKPQLHFENCPNMPPDSRLSDLLARSRANQLGTTMSSASSISSSSRSGPGGTGTAAAVQTAMVTKRKRMREGMSALLYWTISCHRIGLIEVAGNGIRFGRDLSLEPLPFESTRTKVEMEHPELMPKHQQQQQQQQQQQRQTGLGPPTTKSSDRTGLPVPDRIQSRVPSNPDEESALHAVNLPKEVLEVLDEARREDDDHANLLARQEDQFGLSSFMFLTVKQAAICHASVQDFATRGKKTKLMRVGFTGFCCRHCKLHYPSVDGAATPAGIDVPTFQNSCRSFSSSHDNLASAMSNSFVLHLLKCVYTPRTIKQALQTLKRIHPRQMQQLPYGSQSRVFMLMWERARAADCMTQLPSEATIPRTNNINDHNDGGGGASSEVEDAPEEDDDEEFVPDKEGSPRSETKVNMAMVPQRSSSTIPPGPGRRSMSPLDSSIPHGHTARVLVVDDEETKKLLNDLETSWDPTENDGLILPEDKHLISDYVFLCMRQLKVAHPTPADFKGNRRNNVLSRMAGICCIHCGKNEGHQYIKPSGRSFPSAPDNLASALNSSLYNHMMICPDLPAHLRRGMQNTRKIHSAQCSSLPFGSQRRYFNKLYARLREVPVEQHDVVTDIPYQETPAAVNNESYNVAVQKYEFLYRAGCRVMNSGSTDNYWQCQKCRMVPFDYRAPGSLHFERPTVETMKQHFETCEHDGIYWDSIQHSMKELDEKYGAGTKLIDRESFKNLLRSIFGDTDVVFTGFMEILEDWTKSPSKYGSHLWRQLPTTVDYRDVEMAFSVLASELRLESSSLNDHPGMVQFLQQLSCNLQVPVHVAEVDATITKLEDASMLDNKTMTRKATSETHHVDDKSLDKPNLENFVEGTIQQDRETVSLEVDGTDQQKSDSAELGGLASSSVNSQLHTPFSDVGFGSTISPSIATPGPNSHITKIRTEEEQRRLDLQGASSSGYAASTTGESLFSRDAATDQFNNIRSSNSLVGTINKPVTVVDSTTTEDKSWDDPYSQFEDP